MRKYIDIIREFAEFDPDEGGGDKNQTYHVFDILWDVDDPADEAALPKKLTVDTAEIEEHLDPYRDHVRYNLPPEEEDMKQKIGQYLQNAIDWRLSDFDYRPI